MALDLFGDPLTRVQRLLVDATARVSCGADTGTAFFVSHGTLLTAGHVVRSGHPVTLLWRGATISVTVERPWTDHIDVGLLRCRDFLEHPCVYLDPEVHGGDTFTTYGFTADFPHGISFTVTRRGPVALDRERSLVLLHGDDVVEGCSGAPLLSHRTLGVAGVVTHGRRTGGAAIPLSDLFEQYPQLVSENARSHQPKSRWLRQLPLDPFRSYCKSVKTWAESPQPGFQALGALDRYWLAPSLCVTAESPTEGSGRPTPDEQALLGESGMLYWQDLVKCMGGGVPRPAAQRERSELTAVVTAAHVGSHVRLRISGPSGSGKSTLLRWCAAHALESPSSFGLREPSIPFFVRAVALAEAEGSSVSTWCAHALEQDGVVGLLSAPPTDFVPRWIREKDTPWLFLIDSVEEVPAHRRERFVTRLSALADLGVHLILVGHESTSQLQLPNFRHASFAESLAGTTDLCAAKWFGDRADSFSTYVASVDASLKGSRLTLALLAEAFSSHSKNVEGMGGLMSILLSRLVEKLKAALEPEIAEFAEELILLVTVVQVTTSGLETRKAVSAFLRKHLGGSPLRRQSERTECSLH